METGILFSSIAKYAAMFLVPYGLISICYQVFFHPLKNYPGPVFAKLTDAYSTFFALSGRLHLAAFQSQKTYGVVRLGPKKLVFNSAQALQDIYNNDRVTKSHVYRVTITNERPSVFNAIDKELHRVRRKIIGQSINDKAMRAFEPTMIKQVNVFIGQLLDSSRTSSPVDMTALSKRLGMDIVGLLSFGYPLNTQTEETNRIMLRGLKVATYLQYQFMQFPLIKKLRLHYLLVFVQHSHRLKYLSILRRMISTRLSQETHAQADLYSFVADSLDKGDGGLATLDLWSEALFFFPAGGDTTATAISALFFYLSRHRNVYEKLAEEIRTTFENEEEIRGGPKLTSCKYLRACIDEALRICPPVSGITWRELYAAEQERGPLVVDGHIIPPGTQVGVCIYSIHHNEKYFKDPYTFFPERWLDSDESTLKVMHSAFFAFSVGARGCAGKSMAYLEASLVFAKTLWHFDFETAPGAFGAAGAGIPGRRDGRGRSDEYQLYDSFGAEHEGPNLIFNARGDGAWKK